MTDGAEWSRCRSVALLLPQHWRAAPHLGLRAAQGKYDVIKINECSNVRAHKEKKREEELAGLQHDFTVKKEQLRSLVDQHNLRDADPLGTPTAPLLPPWPTRRAIPGMLASLRPLKQAHCVILGRSRVGEAEGMQADDRLEHRLSARCKRLPGGSCTCPANRCCPAVHLPVPRGPGSQVLPGVALRSGPAAAQAWAWTRR